MDRFNILKDWTTESGLRAAIVEGHGDSHLCGYVAVPEGHPLHGKDYSDNCEFLEPRLNERVGKRGILALVCGAVSGNLRRPDNIFDVHGSITYSGKDGYPVATDQNLWWFGFDCNHADDTRVICDEEYVESECESLARQLADVCVDI